MWANTPRNLYSFLCGPIQHEACTHPYVGQHTMKPVLILSGSTHHEAFARLCGLCVGQQNTQPVLIHVWANAPRNLYSSLCGPVQPEACSHYCVDQRSTKPELILVWASTMRSRYLIMCGPTQKGACTHYRVGQHTTKPVFVYVWANTPLSV